MTDLEITIKAAERTFQVLAEFADSTRVRPEHHTAAVYDIGAFGVFLEALQQLQKEHTP